MADAPVIGTPTAVSTHEDGHFSVDFGWAEAPDSLWLKTLRDLMKRSGQESATASTAGITLAFDPQDAEHALDDFKALLTDADQHYVEALERRDAAVTHVKDALLERYGVGPDLPVRET